MTKAIFVLLCLFGLALSLKVSHEQTLPPGLPADQQEAFMRMLNFVKSDPSLLQALQNGQEPNAAQLSKLTNFMIGDTFFQNQLIEGVTSTPENDWLKTISKNGQLRYLKISLLDNPSIMNKIVNRLLKDKEIGPAMAKKYGPDVNNAQFLKNFKNELQSSVAAAKHHLFSM